MGAEGRKGRRKKERRGKKRGGKGEEGSRRGGMGGWGRRDGKEESGGGGMGGGAGMKGHPTDPAVPQGGAQTGPRAPALVPEPTSLLGLHQRVSAEPGSRGAHRLVRHRVHLRGHRAARSAWGTPFSHRALGAGGPRHLRHAGEEPHLMWDEQRWEPGKGGKHFGLR